MADFRSGWTVTFPAETVPAAWSPSTVSVRLASPARVGLTTGLKMPSRRSLSATKRSSLPLAWRSRAVTRPRVTTLKPAGSRASVKCATSGESCPTTRAGYSMNSSRPLS
jgi:hypothetical protein